MPLQLTCIGRMSYVRMKSWTKPDILVLCYHAGGSIYA